jgi:predicted Zn-ribbon and HTH transcriptional regulator
MADTTYIADCLDCKYHWVSRAGFGTPDQCPHCRSKRIQLKPR